MKHVVEAETAEHAEDAAPKARSVLESLQPRQRLTGAEAAARSRFVAQMRVILPVIAVILIGIFFLSAKKQGPTDVRLNDFVENAAKVSEKYSVSGATVAGVTKDGKPYQIEFQSLAQSTADEQTADLVNPRATTQQTDTESNVVSADHGRLDNAQNHLQLRDNVAFSHKVAGENYLLKSDTADVDVKGGVVTVNSGVVGKSETGDLRADRMQAYNADGRVVFEGNVSIRITPKQAPAADKPPPAAKEPPAGVETPK